MRLPLTLLIALAFAGSAIADQVPETPVLTGPNFQQVPASDILVRPTGGAIQTLGDALATPTVDVTNATVRAAGGTTSAALSKLVPLSLLNFGASCDGSTNDSAAVTAAVASGLRISIPTGFVCNAPSIAFSSMPGVFLGPGQVRTSAGNLSAPLSSTLSAAPAVTNNWSTILTAWNGSLGGLGVAHQHIVTGAATLGQPSSGYMQTIEASGEARYGYNTSGWNQSLSGNDGRTGLAFNYTKVDQYGQGDFVAHQCSGIVASTLPGATHYLASPAVECFAGTLFAGANGAYIEFLGDMGISDQNFDIAAVGTEINFKRNTATENLSANWIADLRQVIGTKPIDAAYRVSGPLLAGIDLSNATMTYYRMANMSNNTAGSGYVVGDVLTASGGTSITPTKVSVATIDGSGGVTGWTVVNTGIYTVPPVTTFSAVTLTGGTGTGAGISAYYDVPPALALPTTGGCIKPAAGTGAVNVEQLGFYSALCVTTAGLTFGPNMTMPAGAGSLNFATGTNHLFQSTGNTAFGQYVYDVAQKNSMFFSSGQFAGQGAGKSQTSWRIMRATGTSGSTIRLTTDQGAASGTNSYLVQASSAHNLSFRVTCIDTTDAGAAIWKLKSGALTRTSGGNATFQGDASGATAPDYSTGSGATASLIQAADTSLQNLNTSITLPANGHAWRCEQLLEGDQIE